MLTAVLLLNVLGYYGIFLGMQYRHTKAITRLLDADIYDPAHTVTIKIPLSIPYMADEPEFGRVNGTFEHDGLLYRIVKRRYAQDTVTIICVRDTSHESINKLLVSYVKTFADAPPDKSLPVKIPITIIKEYLREAFSIRSFCNGWSAEVIRNDHRGMLVSSFNALIAHPPESH